MAGTRLVGNQLLIVKLEKKLEAIFCKLYLVGSSVMYIFTSSDSSNPIIAPTRTAQASV